MLIPFKSEHIELMALREHEAELYKLVPGMGDTLAASTVSRTGIIDGRIVAAGGVHVNCFNVGEAWFLPTVYLSEHGITALRFIRDWLEIVRETHGLERMQTASLADDATDKWMQFLGFEKEGIMRHYALGKDYAMWGRLWV